MVIYALKREGIINTFNQKVTVEIPGHIMRIEELKNITLTGQGKKSGEKSK